MEKRFDSLPEGRIHPELPLAESPETSRRQISKFTPDNPQEPDNRQKRQNFAKPWANRARNNWMKAQIHRWMRLAFGVLRAIESLMSSWGGLVEICCLEARFFQGPTPFWLGLLLYSRFCGRFRKGSSTRSSASMRFSHRVDVQKFPGEFSRTDPVVCHDFPAACVWRKV